MLLTLYFYINSCSPEGATKLSTLSAYQFCLLFTLSSFYRKIRYYN